MISQEDQNFSITEFMEVCASWPAVPLPVQKAQDPVLDSFSVFLQRGSGAGAQNTGANPTIG